MWILYLMEVNGFSVWMVFELKHRPPFVTQPVYYSEINLENGTKDHLRFVAVTYLWNRTAQLQLMAAAESSQPTIRCYQLEEIRDIATCAICLELFDNARLLSCSHSFCFNCLWALTEDRPNSHNRCPQCREPSIPPRSSFSDISLHTFVNQLADLVREHDREPMNTAEGKLLVYDWLVVEGGEGGQGELVLTYSRSLWFPLSKVVP